ncbi:conjugative transposon protein [Lasius niger]|uniref:Conjugative transposon protein n=1 Tax=Lasius niger TaxID=67767 RepID=A0A0J7MWL5_LASNI|nr:conjugative transposon protein [Lasius niger]
MGHPILIVVADPVREPVAEKRPGGGGGPNRPKGDAAFADQRAQRQQDHRGRQQQRQKRQRLAERQEEDNGNGPAFVLTHDVADPVDNVIEAQCGAPDTRWFAA